MSQRDVPLWLQGLSTDEWWNVTQEFFEGCCITAIKAEERKVEALNSGDGYEAKAWGNVASLYWMMAEHQLIEEPATHLSFYSYDERIGDKKSLLEGDRALLLSIMADKEKGKEITWTQSHLQVVGAALQRLTPKQREIAEAYYMGGVKRKELPSMFKMPLSTVDTHIRDVNKLWREFASDVNNGKQVQASWLGHLHEVTETPTDGGD